MNIHYLLVHLPKHEGKYNEPIVRLKANRIIRIWVNEIHSRSDCFWVFTVYFISTLGGFLCVNTFEWIIGNKFLHLLIIQKNILFFCWRRKLENILSNRSCTCSEMIFDNWKDRKWLEERFDENTRLVNCKNSVVLTFYKYKYEIVSFLLRDKTKVPTMFSKK